MEKLIIGKIDEMSLKIRVAMNKKRKRDISSITKGK
jgi:hypothetical protein